MSFYWVSTGYFIKALFSKYVWAIPNQENKIFLKDTKNIKLAKSIGSEVKALNRSFSALTTLKKNDNTRLHVPIAMCLSK